LRLGYIEVFANLTRRHLFTLPIACVSLATSERRLNAQVRVAEPDANRVQLILDRQSVQSADDIEFHLHQATKHPENPVIIPGMPHEWDGLQINWPSQVLYDRESKLFRCWYNGLEAVQYDPKVYPERKGFAHWLGRVWMLGYAESKDGVHWEKPSLDQYRHRGMPTNVIKTDYERQGTGIGFDHFGTILCVWPNPAPRSPEEKYLGQAHEIGSDSEGNITFKLSRNVMYSSPDGKRWKRGKVFYDAPSTSDEVPAPNVIDINQVIVEPNHPNPSLRVKAYGQTDRPLYKGRSNRGVGVVHGPDFLSLRYEDLQIVMEADGTIEDEIHWNRVARLENGYYLMIHDSSHFDYSGQAAPTADQRLAISSDGIQFRRIHPHSAMIPRGTKAMFDANMLVSSSIVEFGDQVHFYYHGTPVIWRPWPRAPEGSPKNIRASTIYPTFMGLATVPRDQFAFATPFDGKTGVLTSLPIELSAGKSLWVNSEGAPNELALTLIAQDGREVTQGRVGAERRMTVYRGIIWNEAVPAGQYRVRASLRGRARLYSLAAL
jgi:hypothetical protein